MTPEGAVRRSADTACASWGGSPPAPLPVLTDNGSFPPKFRDRFAGYVYTPASRGRGGGYLVRSSPGRDNVFSWLEIAVRMPMKQGKGLFLYGKGRIETKWRRKTRILDMLYMENAHYINILNILHHSTLIFFSLI